MKKYLKRVLISILVTCLVTIAIIFSFELAFDGIARPQNDAYNLKKFSIESVSAEEILTKPDCYKAFMERKSDTFYLLGEEPNPNSDYYIYSAGRITGVVTVHTTFAGWEDESLNLLIEATLEHGSATMVLICDGEIVERVELQKDFGTCDFSYKFDKNSNYTVKLICKSARITICTDRVWQ